MGPGSGCPVGGVGHDFNTIALLVDLLVCGIDLPSFHPGSTDAGTRQEHVCGWGRIGLVFTAT